MIDGGDDVKQRERLKVGVVDGDDVLKRDL